VLVILGDRLIEMSVYQTKTFARWAKKAGLQDAELYLAAQEVAAGLKAAVRAGEVKEVKQDE
jgi:hypothetical protein